MDEKPLISIIVPIFNSEMYINKCIESILKQSYTNFELILINDGSTDNSESECLKYVYNDKRVLYFKQKNKGASEARNKGMEKSSGDYICFIDSDDFISLDYLNDFGIHDSSNMTYDIIFQGLYHVKCNKKTKNKITSRNYNEEEVIDAIYYLEKKDNFGYTPIKLFKAEIIKTNNLQFSQDLHISEDLEFTLKFCFYASKIKIVAKYNYFYIQNSNSLSHNKIEYSQLKKRNIQLKKISNKIIDKFKAESHPYSKYIKQRYITGYVQAIITLYNSRDHNLKDKIRDISVIKKIMSCSLAINTRITFKVFILHLFFLLASSYMINKTLNYIYRK